jgi:hypothetical protein
MTRKLYLGMYQEITIDGRFFGLSVGDWTMLAGGCGLAALAVLLL